jgi:2-C-methyl-D-erythritol 4-phosphate cytidylyltransferase
VTPSVTAIVPAAGSGKRLKSATKKPFVEIKGRPLLYHTLKALGSSRAIGRIIVASEKSQIARVEEIVKKFGLRKVARVVAGGRTRFDSVKNCIDAVGPSTDIILIHDAARPLVSIDIIERSIAAASKYGACIVAVPENDTIKLSKGGGFVNGTLDRRNIWRAQTPQVFRASFLKKAFRSGRPKGAVTDDSSVAEAAGGRVRIVCGSYSNIKITTPEDLKIAEALL